MSSCFLFLYSPSCSAVLFYLSTCILLHAGNTKEKSDYTIQIHDTIAIRTVTGLMSLHLMSQRPAVRPILLPCKAWCMLLHSVCTAIHILSCRGVSSCWQYTHHFLCDDEACEMPVTVCPPLKAAVHKGFGAGQYVGGWCKS